MRLSPYSKLVKLAFLTLSYHRQGDFFNNILEQRRITMLMKIELIYCAV